jgi:hypothetical protein
MMKLIDVVQRLKLVNDYDQCRAAMNDAIVEIESLRQQLTKPADDTINVSKELKPVAMRFATENYNLSWRDFDSDLYERCKVKKINIELAFTESQLKAEVERAVKECAYIASTYCLIEHNPFDAIQDEILELLDKPNDEGMK